MTHAVTNAMTSDADIVIGRTGPSFVAALCGFLSTTVATTMLVFLISSIA